MIFVWLLSCGAPEPLQETPHEATDCTLAYRSHSPQYSPAEWAHALPINRGQVVFFAEHHGQAHQLQQLSQGIELLASKSDKLIFAAEWLPASATEKLNTLVQNSAWNSQTWWSIISEKYFIAPLELEDYAEPLMTIQRLNQDRSEPIRIVGLAPDCHFQKLKTKTAVTDCLSDRERSMAQQWRSAFPPRSEGMGIISAGYRHAQLIQSDKEGLKPLAMRLAEDYSVYSVLLAGREEDGRSTCKGLFDRQDQERIYPLVELPNSALNTACLSPDPAHDIVPLSAAFTHFWIAPHPWKEGQALPLEAWSSMDPRTLQSWSKFQFELLGGMDLGPNPQTWKSAMGVQLADLDQFVIGSFSCSELEQISSPPASAP